MVQIPPLRRFTQFRPNCWWQQLHHDPCNDVNVLKKRQSIDATATNRTKCNQTRASIHPAPATPEPESRPYAGNYQGLGAGAAATACIGACTASGCIGGAADQKNPPAGAAAKSAATARSSMRGQSKTHVVPSGEAMAGDRRGRAADGRRRLGFRGRVRNWGDSESEAVGGGDWPTGGRKRSWARPPR